MDGMNKHVPVDTKEADGTIEDQEEARYFHEVCVALRTYKDHANADIDKIERSFHQLSESDKSVLMFDIDERVKDMRDAVKLNQSFLNILLTQAEDIKGSNTFECAQQIETGNCCCPTNSVNISKVRSTLKQFAREWSSYREEERNGAYQPLLQGLKKWLPLRDEDDVRWVLCPGSGLGRLPYEVRKLGYSSQGNEFSYFMLIGSYFMLNNALRKNSMVIKPYVLNTMNRLKQSDNTDCVLLPDSSPNDDLDTPSAIGGVEISAAGDPSDTPSADFSMCAGEFCTIYSGVDQRENWDAVVTCFFLDTARNVIQYIRIIAHVLKPNGVWLNLGPLLYHYAGEDNGMSIELSYEELRSIISIWFDIKEEKHHDCLYTSHPNSMMQVVYHSIYFAAIRKANIDPISTTACATSPSSSARKFDRFSPCGPSDD